MARELVRVVRGGEGYLYSDGIHWVLRLFWLNQGKPLHLIPWIAFKIRRYKPEWDSRNNCLDDPHRAGSENLNMLVECQLVEDRPEVAVSF